MATTVGGLARLLATSNAKFTGVASQAFRALAKIVQLSLPTTQRRLLSSTTDLTSGTTIQSAATTAQALALAADSTSVNTTLDPAVVSAISNALAALNSIAASSTDPTQLQKVRRWEEQGLQCTCQRITADSPAQQVAVVASTTLADDIFALASGQVRH